MARANFFIVAENTAPAYVITCQRDGIAIDLTAASVSLILQNKNTNTVTNTDNQACSIVNAASGIISWAAISTDFPSAGTYVADIMVIYNGGGKERLYEQAKWKVRAKIPYTSASVSPSASASPSA